MPTDIFEQLNQLVNDKQDLVDNLNIMGVQSTSTEKFNTLVPKILQVPIDRDNEKQIIEGTITNIGDNNVIEVRRYAFQGCSSLATANLPNCTTIGADAFEDCISLTMANFSRCIMIDEFAFAGCTSLITTSFPACQTIGEGAFQGCSRLTTMSFPTCQTISDGAFAGCAQLSYLYLMGSSVVDLWDSDVFINSGLLTGSIYVPSSLYSSYISDSVWSNFSSILYSL